MKFFIDDQSNPKIGSDPLQSLWLQKLDSISDVLIRLKNRKRDMEKYKRFEIALWDSSVILFDVLSDFYNFSDEITLKKELNYPIQLIPQLLAHIKLAFQFFPASKVNQVLKVHRTKLWRINLMLINSMKT